MGIKLNRSTSHQGCFFLHPELAKIFGITPSTKKHIKFGIQSIPVDVDLTQDLSESKPSLSSDIIDTLKIPLSCSYGIQQNEHEIEVGPFIGLLASADEKSLKKQLDDLRDYLTYYQEIEGAILVFSLENVNKDNLTIKGFLYNPVSKGWEEGIFPYPSSIFIMTKLVNTEWVEHFQSVIGNTVFNNFHFDKWKTHQILTSSPKLSKYVPETILYKSPQDLLNFLKKHSTIMIKSINGSAIFKVSRTKNSLVFTDPKKNETIIFDYKQIDQAYSWFKKYFRNGKFILQKSIELITTHERTIDFRVMMVKDGEGIWNMMGTFARQGKPGAVISSIYPYIELGEKTLQEVWDLGYSKTRMLLNEIFDVSIEAVEVIERYGVHLANSSIDIKIDENGDISILDIQFCNPSHEIALIAGYPNLYYNSLKNNMLYAKKLAGFSNSTFYNTDLGF